MGTTEKIKSLIDLYINKSGHNVSLCPEYGLLCHLYKVKAKNSADKNVVKIIEKNIPFNNSILSNEDEMFLISNFVEVVESCITSKDRKFSHHSKNCQPKEITNLIMKCILHEDMEDEDIYNPFSGFASYAVNDDNDNYFWGEEIDEIVWAIGQIRLYAYGKSNLQEYSLGDSIYNIYNSKDKYRAIVCTPPFGLQGDGAIENLIAGLFTHLEKNGQLIIVTPLGWLASKKASKTRDSLISGRNIESVIQLPYKLFSDTSIPTAIISITSNSNDCIKLVDATVAYVYETNKQFRLNTEIIEKALSSRYRRKDSIRVVSFQYDNLDRHDNILLPSIHFIGESAGLSLYQCVSTVKEKDTIKKGAKIITLKSLSAFYPGEVAKSFPYEEISNNFGTSLIKVIKNSILLSVLPDRVMVGYVDKVEDNTFAAPNIMVLKPHETYLSKSFIIAYLLSEEVQKQLIMLRLGSSTLYENLFKYIVFPPKQESEIVSDIITSCQNAVKNEISSSQQNLNHYIQSVRMRKHAITQTVSSVSARFNALDYCRITNNGVLNDAEKISPLTDITVQESFEYIKNSFKEINDAIMHIADIEWNWSAPKDIDLVSFVRSYIFDNTSHEFDYINNVEDNEAEDNILDADGNITLEKGNPLYLIHFPEDALRYIFKNIISNARAYGFVNRKGKSNKIKFDWFIEGENVVLEISNNGEPLSLDDDKIHYIFMYGYSTSLNKDGHSGQGGAEIYEIMRKYGAKVDIISTPKDEFTVTYQLIFPNIGIDDSSDE